MSGGSHGKVGFTSDGKFVAVSVGRGDVALLAVSPFAPLATFQAAEDKPVSGIAFSPDGAQLAVGSQGQEIRLWNLPLIRRQSAEMKLHYDAPPISPATKLSKPIKSSAVE